MANTMDACIPSFPDSFRKSLSIKHLYCCGLATHCRHLANIHCCHLKNHCCHLATTHCYGLTNHCCRLTVAVIPSVIRTGIRYIYSLSLRLLLSPLSSTYQPLINQERESKADTDTRHTIDMTKSASGDALSVSCLLIPEIWLKITESLEYEPAMISCLKLINRVCRSLPIFESC